eukprot:SAG31_NODE_921_length_10984_cov_2.779329_8_plen_517_part_00
MLRKLALVGFLLIIRRGSVSQVMLACVLSFMFFSAHVKAWPYKMTADNVLKATTEIQIFLTVLVALASKHEMVDGRALETYDWALFASFMLLVPITFAVTVLRKLQDMHRVLTERSSDKMKHPAAWRAYKKYKAAISGDEDNAFLLSWTELVLQEHVEKNKIEKLDTMLNHRHHEVKFYMPDDTTDETTPRAVTLRSQVVVLSNILRATRKERREVEQTAEDDDSLYSKFTGGFDLVVGSMDAFYGGLEQLIGDCRKDVAVAMFEEHCKVKQCVDCVQSESSGGQDCLAMNTKHVEEKKKRNQECTCFGASMRKFTTSNYGITTTAKREWDLVLVPNSQELSRMANFSSNDQRSKQRRLTIPELFFQASSLMSAKFKEGGDGEIVLSQENQKKEKARSSDHEISTRNLRTQQGQSSKMLYYRLRKGSSIAPIDAVDSVGAPVKSGHPESGDLGGLPGCQQRAGLLQCEPVDKVPDPSVERHCGIAELPVLGCVLRAGRAAREHSRPAAAGCGVCAR